MTPSRHFRAVLREAIAVARSQPIPSAVTVIVIAAMCATIFLTTGRAVGSEGRVLGTIDSAGTRSIVIRADAGAGIDQSVVRRISKIEGVEWAAGFGPAVDVHNASVEGGQRVAERAIWSSSYSALGIRAGLPIVGTEKRVFASPAALSQLGMLDYAGAVESFDGDRSSIVGKVQTPSYLRFLEPMVLLPMAPSSARSAITVLVVVATTPSLVAPVSRATQSLLGASDPSLVKVSTSEELAKLRASIQSELGGFGKNLVILVFAITALLVAAIQYGLVFLRRKDFGRRRALGSSRSLIIALLLAQTSFLGVGGALLGTAIASATLSITGDPLPQLGFFIAVNLLAVAIALVGTLPPAIAASRRDPIKELRVP